MVGGRADEVRECQLDSLPRHHIRQRMDQTGRAPRASQGDRARWGGEIREGLSQEVAWAVRLRKRKGWCAKSMAVTAGRAPGQGQGEQAAPVVGN